MSQKTIGLAGHAGIGHVNGYSGFIQDDTAGFVTVASFIKDFLGVDTRINSVEVGPDSNRIRITTREGGISITSPRRGITPAEAEHIKTIIGQDALFCQAVAIKTFGRMYGQGVTETPVALEAALANSVVDSFRKKAPEQFLVQEESLANNCGQIGGISSQLLGIDVSLLVSVNYTKGGIGPVEDLEGNIALGSKAVIMKTLDMLRCPTIVVESKAYLPAISDRLRHNTFLVRAQKDLDNGVVAHALYESAKQLGYPVIFRDDLLPCCPGYMKQGTVNFAERVIQCGERMKRAELASEKVSIAAELAELVSQDAGAITCISNPLHDIVRGTGIIPGTSAVLSILVTRDYFNHWKIPIFDEIDAKQAQDIIRLALQKIALQIDDAYECVDNYFQGLDLLADAIR